MRRRAGRLDFFSEFASGPLHLGFQRVQIQMPHLIALHGNLDLDLGCGDDA